MPTNISLVCISEASYASAQLRYLLFHCKELIAAQSICWEKRVKQVVHLLPVTVVQESWSRRPTSKSMPRAVVMNRDDAQQLPTGNTQRRLNGSVKPIEAPSCIAPYQGLTDADSNLVLLTTKYPRPLF